MGLRYGGLLILAAFAASFFTGCASTDSFTIYSATRDKQGQAAQKAYAEVDYAAQLTAARKNIKALLDEQLALADETWSIGRTATARYLAYSSTLKEYEAELNTRHGVLVGNVDPAEIQKSLDAREKAEEKLEVLGTTFGQAGLPPPSCIALRRKGGLDAARKAAQEQADANKRDTLASGLPAAAEACATLAKPLPADGELGAARAQLETQQRGVEAAQDKADGLKAAYDEVKAAYEKLALKPDDAKSKEAVSTAVEKLGKLVKGVDEAQDAFSTKLVAEERLATLNGFLTNYQDVAAGKGVKDGNKLAIALALFPDIHDKAKKALVDVQQPNLLALAMQKNVEEARLDSARRDIALRQQLVAEWQVRVASLQAQQAALAYALGPFKQTAVEVPRTKTLLEVMTAPDPKTLNLRTMLWGSTTSYLDAEGRLRAETSKSFYRISAIEHERVLTYAESNLNQWKVLIDPSVELLAAYGASGLKSSDIAAFLNSVMLLAIAIGVN